MKDPLSSFDSDVEISGLMSDDIMLLCFPFGLLWEDKN